MRSAILKDEIIEILNDYTVPVFNAISKTSYKNIADDIIKATNDRTALAQEIYDKLLFKWKYIDNVKAITLHDIHEIFDEYLRRADL